MGARAPDFVRTTSIMMAYAGTVSPGAISDIFKLTILYSKMILKTGKTGSKNPRRVGQWRTLTQRTALYDDCPNHSGWPRKGTQEVIDMVRKIVVQKLMIKFFPLKFAYGFFKESLNRYPYKTQTKRMFTAADKTKR